MNIYDKITSCDEIICFIEGDNFKSVTFLYKKEMLKSQFYDATMSFIDNYAKSFLIKEVVINGNETENGILHKSLFSGSYVKLQKAIRGVI